MLMLRNGISATSIVGGRRQHPPPCPALRGRASGQIMTAKSAPDQKPGN